MIKKLKNHIIVFSFSILICFMLYLFQNKVNEAKYFILSFLPSYKKDRELVSQYFDKGFYIKKYAYKLKNDVEPIDHFLQKGWYSKNYKDHTDPNAWFNVTLYKEFLCANSISENPWKQFFSLFQIKVNPFVNFLRQTSIKDHEQTVQIWATKDELVRAWFAIEELLRLDRFNVELHITKNINNEDFIRFAPQIARGLKVVDDNSKEQSFYQSDIIKNPQKYQISIPTGTYLRKGSIFYVMHYFDISSASSRRINPLIINIARYCTEPIAFKFDDTNYLIRISDGFDLMIVCADLPIKNLKIVPGYMETWVDEEELADRKEFSVSFLLSHKKKSKDLRNKLENYDLREKIWNIQDKIILPKKFYLSYRDKKFFSKDIQHRAMPTNSKSWVFNSMFNIAVENTKQNYYFTEKLLGCFMSLTVPIYIGCPNVLDYFDARGILIVNSLDELISVVNSLTPETYEKMLPYVKENKKRALKLLHLEDQIIEEFSKKFS